MRLVCKRWSRLLEGRGGPVPGWSKQMQGARVGKREGGGETGERTWMDGKVLGVNVRAGHHKG